MTGLTSVRSDPRHMMMEARSPLGFSRDWRHPTLEEHESDPEPYACHNARPILGLTDKSITEDVTIAIRTVPPTLQKALEQNCTRLLVKRHLALKPFAPSPSNFDLPWPIAYFFSPRTIAYFSRQEKEETVGANHCFRVAEHRAIGSAKPLYLLAPVNSRATFPSSLKSGRTGSPFEDNGRECDG